ncbi:ABC transporter substrate-binding protein [Chitinimonas sp. BJYL2]|uniref:substrate-binding periplasmic protein n=1 Tax=Chitinimonas sp. BJYL2 TaxID=2976696 RepID=UPI0022B39A32|nr:transporter substrate-binding domain-containing protein [Chitinimonas sp. BJYL2]
MARFCVLCCCAISVVLAAPVMRVGASHFPPFALDPEKPGITPVPGLGVDVDFLVAVLAQAGIKADVRFKPHARQKRELLHGALDVGGSYFFMPDYPEARQILYDQGGATRLYRRMQASPPPQTLAELAGLRLGVVRGDRYGDLLTDALAEGRLLTDLAVDDAENIRKLLAGRVDLIAINEVVGQFIVPELDPRGMLERIPWRLDYGKDPRRAGAYIVFSPKVPLDQIRRVRAATATLLKAGRLDAIKQSYGVGHADP